MLDDFGAEQPTTRSDPTPPPSPAPEAAEAATDKGTSQEPKDKDLRRGRPRAGPGEVAEFLRELSRLALDDE
jgi:hypothetical protein